MILLSRRDLLKHLGACTCGAAAAKWLKPALFLGEAQAQGAGPGKFCINIIQDGGADQWRCYPLIDSALAARISELRSKEGAPYAAPAVYNVFNQPGVPGLNQAFGTVVRNEFLAGRGKLIARFGNVFLPNNPDNRSHAFRANQMSYGTAHFNEQTSEGYIPKLTRVFGLDVQGGYQTFHFGPWRPELRAASPEYKPISAYKAADLIYENLSSSYGGSVAAATAESLKARDVARELWGIRKQSSNPLDRKIAEALLKMDAAVPFFKAVNETPVTGTYTNDSESFGQAMKGVAQLIKYTASLQDGKNRFIQVVIQNWDSHSGTIGVDSLVSLLGSNIGALITDLTAAGLWNRTALFTTTEFGRLNYANGGFGTDHGQGAITLVLGGQVAGGFVGEPFTLADLNRDCPAMDIAFQNVFAQVFAWMGYSSNQIGQIYDPAEYPVRNLQLFQNPA